MGLLEANRGLFNLIRNTALKTMAETGKEYGSDEEVLGYIDLALGGYEADFGEKISYQQKLVLRKEILYSIKGYGMLQELLNDKEVTEIMVNGRNQIFVERHGQIYRCKRSFESDEELEEIIQKIVSSVNRIVNETTPIVDARLQDGSRVNAVLPPVALDGPTLTIRKFPRHYNMEDMIQMGTLSEECAELLKCLVKSRYNIFISGGTGAGKTTFLNALCGYIPKTERIITIEDSAELNIDIPNMIRLESRNENMEGKHAISIRDLIRAALRMRPDRIIVGEVRSEECVDMLTAMNTGHDGSLSTGHANGTKDMLLRLETMVLMGMNLPLPAIRSQIASAIDILVHLERFRDGSRKVVSVEEVIDYYDEVIHTQSLFFFDYEEGILKPTNYQLVHGEKMGKG